MNDYHPSLMVADVISGGVAWVSYSGFIQKEIEVGLLSELAAGVSLLWFATRFIMYLWDRWNGRDKHHTKCRCKKQT